MSPSEERDFARAEFNRLKKYFDSRGNVLGAASKVLPFPFSLIPKFVSYAGPRATLDYWYMQELEKFLNGEIPELPSPPDNANDHWHWGR